MTDRTLVRAAAGTPPGRKEALALADFNDLAALTETAEAITLAAFGPRVTYSRKVFAPLTELCRDVCHYCTFAKAPRRIDKPFMTPDDVLALARQGEAAGCREMLFTLGDKPELRYRVAREALDTLGHTTTLAYLADAARLVLDETGLLPHLNPGIMSAEDLATLRPVSASMGIMLETASDRLCAAGMAHHGSPDKDPALRLATIREAGRQKIPFTSGILIGIGETRRERIEALLALRELHDEFGHLQEIIVQNFRAKPGTRMADAPEPDLADHQWTIAVARILFGGSLTIQAPPNLRAGETEGIILAGIDDWGGVSPVTPDHVNPEAPWPHLDVLRDETAAAGRTLTERLAVHPRYALAGETWLADGLRAPILRAIDADGLPRTDPWHPGMQIPLPFLVGGSPDTVSSRKVEAALAAAESGEGLDRDAIVALFSARGPDVDAICAAADDARSRQAGETIRYVVNRNINYTNVCLYRCSFCAFSKGKTAETLRGSPYDLASDEIARRTAEAWDRGATEVCLQGGIHPHYTGETYLEILRIVKEAAPGIHVHAFSPLEVTHGATTLGLPLHDYLAMLRDAGLGSLPGTAAEILDDEVRAIICPDKVTTAEWLNVMATAHVVGLRSTATIMFGHVEEPRHWAAHLTRIRDLQATSGGFTEFVPLPFVHMEAPVWLKGRARSGPTYREALLMHAVARLVLGSVVPNIQTSWVKMGPDGASACLTAGANDLGGVLMNESITRAAGATHGQELGAMELERIVRDLGRTPAPRTTLYRDVPEERRAAARDPVPLAPVVNTPLARQARPTVSA